MVLGCYTDDVPPLKRIVVAIDPNASSSEDFNECGIVRASFGDDDQGYILDDLSGVMAPIGHGRPYRFFGNGGVIASLPRSIMATKWSKIPCAWLTRACRIVRCGHRVRT